MSTNNISDPGIDLAGSSHMHYSPNVMVISVPCTSGIKPSWALYAVQQGFDGVFVAADGDECAYLSDCSARTSQIMAEAQTPARRTRLRAAAPAHGGHLLGLRRAVHQLHARVLRVPDQARTLAKGIGGMKYDALVVGSGIGGMESALKLGDMGYKVLVVEKQASVGGKMILLSKVFPTLDCASCISTPKMAATIHHPNIDVLTYAEVDGIRSDGNGGYRATIRQKPKFIDEVACTGCRQCEMACNVAVPDEFNADMVSRRAAYIAFPQAVPKKAVIERAGVSPCTFNCPAGIKAHGYVARVRSGEYDQAFDLVLETTPLVGSLGRACYAPCEDECTRGELEGPLPIRRLKRFIADRRYGQAEPKPVVRPEPNGKKVAVVGSGPGRPHRRLAARAQGLRRQDLRSGVHAGRHAQPRHPGLSPAQRRRRRRRRQRHGDRCGDRHRQPHR